MVDSRETPSTKSVMVRPVIRVPRLDTTNTPPNGSSNNQGNTGLKHSLGMSQQTKRSGPIPSPKASAFASERTENRDINRDTGREQPKVLSIPKPRSNKKVDFGPGMVSSNDKRLSKVPSLMFDMEDTFEDECGSAGNHFDDTVPSPQVLERLKDMLVPQDDDEYMLSMHVKYARDDALERYGEEMEVDELGERLRTLGYTVRLRTALGGGSSGGSASCLRNLRHCFLAVTLSNNAEDCSKEVIVDPKFLDQFEIAHSTMRYDFILSAVPSAVVAPMGRLIEGVSILCEEMARAFQKTGTPLPPWRQTSAMLSKWQPRRSEDVDMMRRRDSSRQSSKFTLERIQEDGKKTNNTVAEKLVMMGVNVHSSTTPDQADSEALYASDEPDESRVKLPEKVSEADEDTNNMIAMSL